MPATPGALTSPKSLSSTAISLAIRDQTAFLSDYISDFVEKHEVITHPVFDAVKGTLLLLLQTDYVSFLEKKPFHEVTSCAKRDDDKNSLFYPAINKMIAFVCGRKGDLIDCNEQCLLFSFPETKFGSLASSCGAACRVAAEMCQQGMTVQQNSNFQCYMSVEDLKIYHLGGVERSWKQLFVHSLSSVSDLPQSNSAKRGIILLSSASSVLSEALLKDSEALDGQHVLLYSIDGVALSPESSRFADNSACASAAERETGSRSFISYTPELALCFRDKSLIINSSQKAILVSIFVGVSFSSEKDLSTLQSVVVPIQMILDQFVGIFLSMTPVADRGVMIHCLFGGVVSNSNDQYQAFLFSEAVRNDLRNQYMECIISISGPPLFFCPFGFEDRLVFQVHSLALVLAHLLIRSGELSGIFIDQNLHPSLSTLLFLGPEVRIGLEKTNKDYFYYPVIRGKTYKHTISQKMPTMGRESDARFFNSIFSDVQYTARNSVICIEADIGLGKTHFLKTWRETLDPSLFHHRILFFDCPGIYQSNTSFSLWWPAIASMLHRGTSSSSSKLSVEFADLFTPEFQPYLALLNRIFPSLENSCILVETAEQIYTEQFLLRFFQEIVAGLNRENSRISQYFAQEALGPKNSSQIYCCFILEDLQFADASSLALLKLLISRLHHCIFICTWRPNVLDICSWLKGNAQLSLIFEPFSDDILITFMMVLLQVTTINQSIQQHYFHLLNGNPYKTIQILNYLLGIQFIMIEKRCLVEDQSFPPLINLSLEAVFHSLLNEQSKLKQSILRIASVYGTITMDDASNVIHLQQPVIEIVQAFSELEYDDFLTSVKGNLSDVIVYRIKSQVIWEFIYTHMADDQKIFFHLQRAESLKKQLKDPTIPSFNSKEIADHFNNANCPSDAFQFYNLGGDYEHSIFHEKDALYCYYHAWNLCLHVIKEVRVQSIILFKIATILERMDQYEKAIQTYISILTLMHASARPSCLYVCKLAPCGFRVPRTRGMIQTAPISYSDSYVTDSSSLDVIKIFCYYRLSALHIFISQDLGLFYIKAAHSSAKRYLDNRISTCITSLFSLYHSFRQGSIKPVAMDLLTPEMQLRDIPDPRTSLDVYYFATVSFFALGRLKLALFGMRRSRWIAKYLHDTVLLRESTILQLTAVFMKGDIQYCTPKRERLRMDNTLPSRAIDTFIGCYLGEYAMLQAFIESLRLSIPEQNGKTCCSLIYLTYKPLNLFLPILALVAEYYASMKHDLTVALDLIHSYFQTPREGVGCLSFIFSYWMVFGIWWRYAEEFLGNRIPRNCLFVGKRLLAEMKQFSSVYPVFSPVYRAIGYIYNSVIGKESVASACLSEYSKSRFALSSVDPRNTKFWMLDAVVAYEAYQSHPAVVSKEETITMLRGLFERTRLIQITGFIRNLTSS